MASNTSRSRKSRSKSPGRMSVADRAVNKIADERDAIQKKVFTKWVNSHLTKLRIVVRDLFTDFSDGRNLLSLLEILSDEKLPREKGNLRFHKLQNVQTALNFLESHKVKVVNIRSSDIVDGDAKLILGLVWLIILHFQISSVKVMMEEEKLSPKEALMVWCKNVCEGYPGIGMANFKSSFQDGLAFNAIVHRHRPDIIDYKWVLGQPVEIRLTSVFKTAEEELGVNRLLDVEDIKDERSVLTYISSLYKCLPSVPPEIIVQAEEEREAMAEEYTVRMRKLTAWITMGIQQVSNREFPNEIDGVRVLMQQHLFLRSDVIPVREEECRSLRRFLRDVQAMYNPKVKFFIVPDGLHPKDMDSLWHQFSIAVDERTHALKAELSRQEHLQTLSEKIEKECILVNSALDDIEERTIKDEAGIDKLPKNESRRRFGQLLSTLKVFEPHLNNMTKYSTVLTEQKFQFSPEVTERVTFIVTRFHQIRQRVQGDMNQVTTGSSTNLTPSPSPVSFADEPGLIALQQRAMQASPMSSEAFSLTPVPTPEPRPVIEENIDQQMQVEVSTGRDDLFLSSPEVESPAHQSFVTSTASSRRSTLESSSEFSEGKSPSKKAKKNKSGRSKPKLPSLWACTKTAMNSSSDEETKPKPMPKSYDPNTIARSEAQVVLSWIDFKRGQLNVIQYGLDLGTNEKLLTQSEALLQEIIAYKPNIERICEMENTNTPSDIQSQISGLRDYFAEIVTQAEKRVEAVSVLVTFMRDATEEMIWMNRVEEDEVSRDWSIVHSNLHEVERYEIELQVDMMMHEEAYNRLQSKGNALLNDGHPAQDAIKAYCKALTELWYWIIELTIALKIHLAHAQLYNKFYMTSEEANNYLVDCVQLLESILDDKNPELPGVALIIYRQLLPAYRLKRL